MKRLTTKLLAVAVGCLVSMGAWAQTTLAAFNVELTSAPTSAYASYETTTYSVMCNKVGSSSSSNYKTYNDKYYLKFTGDDAYVTIKLKSDVFIATDVVNIYMTQSSKKTTGCFIKSTSGNSATVEVPANGEGIATYFLTLDDINEDGSVTFYRYNSNLYVNAITIERVAPATPSISSFTAAGVEATIANDTISAELPFGTDLTNLTPVVTLGGSATNYSPTGVVDFSNSATVGSAVEYTVSDGVAASQTYKVILTAATTASTEKDLTNITIGGEAVELTGNAGSVFLSKSADLSALVVTFDIPATATADFTSGNTFDFTSNSLTITVTAQDNSTAAYTLSASKGTKDILYLTTSSAEDLFLNQLKGKGYYVTARAGQATAPANYDGIDLVVLHESLAGGDGAGTAKELALIKEVDVPILNTKSYFYKAGSSPRWGWGTAANGNSQTYVTLNTAVYSNIAAHPVFAGLTIAEDTTIILGTETAKNIQPIASFETGFEGYSLATVPAGCAIHELPAAARLTSGASKYLLVSILSTKFNDLTDNGLKLLDNACNYLMGSDVWTPVLVSTALSQTTLSGVSYVNGIIRNANGVALQVYNATGKLVATGMENIDMSSFAAGVYVIRTNEGAMKIVK